MYRIIGVFDDYTHGVTGEYLLKLISSNFLTSISWGTITSKSSNYTNYENYQNDWTGSVTGVPASGNII